jgi:quercetin dioxygenase-like cupin family protein
VRAGGCGGRAGELTPDHPAERPEERDSMTPLVATSAVTVMVILLSAVARTTEPGAALLAAQAGPPDAPAADPARYTVLNENDVAQVIRVTYQAGTRSVMHSHPAGCAIFYKDATLKMTSPTGEARTHEYRAGDVSCGDGHSHVAENVGRDTEFIQVHLKNRKTFDHVQTGRSLVYPARIKAPDPIDADPSHYFVQFENDAVRVARIKVPGGVTTPMHAHLAYCIVEIRDMETGVKAGDSSCGSAMAHASPNNARSVNEAITIEFKNRDNFK